MNEKMDRLREILAEVDDLQRAASLLSWDQETYMPPGGVEARAQQLSTLSRLSHVRFTSDEVGKLLDELEGYAAGLDYDSDDAALFRVARRDYDLAHKVPAELVAEAAHAGSVARPAWIEARQKADFSIFAPFLKKNVELSRRQAEALGYEDHPYDALINVPEPGMTTAQLKGIFSRLREAIVPLVREIAARQDMVDASCLHGDFDEQKQLDFGLGIAQKFGYDLQRGRQDLTAHPFCITFSTGDVRITTRVDRSFLSMALFGTMHESGHAMYEQGVNPAYDRSPLASGASLGVHESQSRLWENLVGRSRAFWQYYYPRLQETFPEHFGKIDREGFYRAVNKVQPSMIRVEADEVTYNLHILLRFELETAMLDGSLSVDELPEAWNAKMQEYLGITPPSDREGVLQDMHWSGAWLAGFPYYTLGNIIGAQLFAKIREAIPNLDEQIAAGEFGALHGWLVENLYRHGRKFTPNELVERITGAPLSTGPWIEYVSRKFGEIYGLARD